VDPELYYPCATCATRTKYDCGYLGTYSDDRQPTLDRLLLSVARRWAEGRFVVAGPQYPERITWPANVDRVLHLEPARHRHFYTTLRYALNITRRDMVAAGYSPSVRLFEAAACGTPIISDAWNGLDTFFTPRAEILLVQRGSHTQRYLRQLPEDERREIGARARDRVLLTHTAARRACELEGYLAEAGLKAAVPVPAARASAAVPAPAARPA
jgi:spore maturation protein CgeB